PTFPRKQGKESRWRLPPRKRGKEQAQAPSPATRGRAGVGARGIATGTTGLRQLPPSRPSPARGGKEQVVAPSPQAGEGVGDGRCPNPETGAGRRRSDAATPTHYIRNTPNLAGSIGALSEAEIPSASTRRVSAGSMMPSSHSRAVEYH